MRVIALVLLVGCGGEPVAPEADAPPEAASVLADEAYRFCHEAGVDAEVAEAWCPLLEGQDESVCPGLRATCEGAPPVQSGCGGTASGGGGAPNGVSGAPDKPSPSVRTQACDLPQQSADMVQLLGQWVMAILVAAVLLVIVRLIWGYLGRTPRTERSDPLPVSLPVESVLEDLPDRPTDELLAAAKAALVAQRFGEAVLMARAAALRGLGDAGRIRLHRARTDREYLRSVRRDQEIEGPLRDIVGVVEVHRWGGRRVTADLARRAVEAAARLVRVGIVSAVVLMVGAGDARGQEDRYGPIGDAAFFDLLVGWGYDVHWRLRGLDTLDDGTDVLVLDASQVQLTDEGWQSLRQWVIDGGVLWVAGDAPWEEVGPRVDLEGSHRLVGDDALADQGMPTPMLPDGPWAAYESAHGFTWVRAAPQVGPEVPGEVWTVVGSAEVGLGAVVMFSDPRLIWNGAFIRPENEVFVGELLHVGQAARGWPLPSPIRVELATTASAADPSPARSVMNANLLPFVFQLLLCWALLALWKGWPFGPLRDPPSEGRRAFTEHVRALGRRWMRIRATRYALAAYAGLWLQRQGPAGLVRMAARAGMDPERAKRWVDALQAVAADPNGPASAGDLDRMEELWTITNRR